MRKYWLLLFQIVILVTVLSVGFTSCTTSDSEDGFEDELNAELDDMGGESLDDAEVASDDSDASAEAESDITADNEDDFSDENFEEDTKAKTASADEAPKSEDEFAAEDAQNPAAETASSTDDLAEQDLANELGKGKDGGAPAAAATTAANPPSALPPANDQIVPYPDEPSTSASNIPAGLKADEAEIAAATAPSTAGVATGTITSKESSLSNDPFEQITTGPSVPSEDIGVSDPLVTEVDPPLPAQKAAQEIVPVAKVEKNPFFKNERLMNTFYIARPNEDVLAISQKIFGEDKKTMLEEDNPHIIKGVETGDKIYYNSPNRPEDKKAIMSYYEDNKMTPMYYVTKKGDDIQKIGRQVLGYEDAWKEVWAVNDTLQTQALLPSGLKLRYWTGNEIKMHETPVPAATEPPPQIQQASVKEEVPIDLPPAEPAALPSEDPGLSMSSNPAPLPTETLATAPSIDSGEKENNLMTLAGGAIAVLAILALVAIQIKNRKRESHGVPPSLEFNKV